MSDASGTPATIAFIGLGQMGLPMARRLIQAGFTVRGADPAERAAPRARRGRRPAFAAPSEAAEGADMLITMLPNGAIVRDVLLGARRRARPGQRRAGDRHELLGADRHGRPRRRSRTAGAHADRCAGLRRRQARHRRIARDHGRRTGRGGRARPARAGGDGQVDLRDGADRLRPCDEGAEQLRLGGRAGRGLRGPAGRRPASASRRRRSSTCSTLRPGATIRPR